MSVWRLRAQVGGIAPQREAAHTGTVEPMHYLGRKAVQARGTPLAPPGTSPPAHRTFSEFLHSLCFGL